MLFSYINLQIIFSNTLENRILIDFEGHTCNKLSKVQKYKAILFCSRMLQVSPSLTWEPINRRALIK